MSATLLPLVDEWLDEKVSLGRGLSRSSERAYRVDLDRVARELLAGGGDPDRPALEQVTVEDLTDVPRFRSAIASLSRDGLAASTRARHIGTWGQFVTFLRTRGYLLVDPMLGVSRPQVREALPVALSDADLLRVITVTGQVDEQARFPWPERDTAVVAVLAGAGVRASELVGLTVGAVSRDDPPTLRVHGKGGKWRQVPVPGEVITAIDTYLVSLGERFDGPRPPDAPLFVTYRGAALTTSGLRWHVYRWCVRAGLDLPEQEAVHVFRHTYAMALVRNGVDIRTIQTLLGHAKITTTQVYLRMTGVEVAQAVQVLPVRRMLAGAKPAP